MALESCSLLDERTPLSERRFTALSEGRPAVAGKQPTVPNVDRERRIDETAPDPSQLGVQCGFMGEPRAVRLKPDSASVVGVTSCVDQGRTRTCSLGSMGAHSGGVERKKSGSSPMSVGSRQ